MMSYENKMILNTCALNAGVDINNFEPVSFEELLKKTINDMEEYDYGRTFVVNRKN